MKQKVLSWMLTLSLFASMGVLTGCGSSGATNVPADSSADTSADKPIVIKIAFTDSEERTLYTEAEKFGEYVEAESDGRLKVELYPNGQLGGDKEALEAIQLGTLEATICGASVMGSFDKRLGMLDLPFLFDDYEEMTAAIVDGPLGELYSGICEEYGFKVLAYDYDGARCISNNVRPIYTVDDCKGLKLRVMETDVYISLMKAFGANPTPMSFSELYTAMAQNVVDGQDNPPSIGYTSKFHEVQKYYSWTRHSFQNSPLFISKSFYESLPEDLQTIVSEGAKQMETAQRTAELANEKNTEALINESDTCTANEVTDRESFKEAARVVYDDFRELIGEDEVNKILEAAGKSGVY